MVCFHARQFTRDPRACLDCPPVTGYI
jgi:hypothetical protein